MKLSNVKTEKDFQKYLDQKIEETYIDMHNELGLSECIDEYGETVDPQNWYWRGVSPQMNEDVEVI